MYSLVRTEFREKQNCLKRIFKKLWRPVILQEATAGFRMNPTDERKASQLNQNYHLDGRITSEQKPLLSHRGLSWAERRSEMNIHHHGRQESPTRKPRINSQLVAQQVAQQYPMPPPPKKERRERSERSDKERPDGEGERAFGEVRPEVERPEVERPEVERPEVERPEIRRPEGDAPEKEKSDTEQQPIKDKPDRERGIIAAVTKKPSSKKTRPKSDNHQSPPSEKHSIQSGKSVTKTNKNSHISRPRLKNIDRSTAQQLAITVGNVTVIITDFKEKTRSSSTSSSTITSSVGSEQQHQSSGSESMDKGSSRASTPKGELSVGHDESF
ncbi:hypothetical protein F7725_016535 [Dissostichus mawsoni]|uniref:Uncharacterized protein n=1 Tax=Dissostichus mawsoni TaxID=36200 RepID=A0A7J5Z1W4_DISMA|nr:hypothetical protein F7725_016535 [Dissostichus mawsoni]